MFICYQPWPKLLASDSYLTYVDFATIGALAVSVLQGLDIMANTVYTVWIYKLAFNYDVPTADLLQIVVKAFIPKIMYETMPVLGTFAYLKKMNEWLR